jgi:hypothetical protein
MLYSQRLQTPSLFHDVEKLFKEPNVRPKRTGWDGGQVVAVPSELIHICFQSYFPLSYQYKHAYLWNQSAP